MNALVNHTPVATDEVAQLVKELASGLKFEYGQRALARLPTAEEAVKLKERQDALYLALRPISYTAHGPALRDAGAEIAEMLYGFEAWKAKNLDKTAQKLKEDSVGWYVHELRDMPLYAVKQACLDVRQNRVPDLNPDYPPSSARMVALARVHSDALRAQHNTVKMLLSTHVVVKPELADPKMQERIANKMRDLAAGLRDKLERERTEEQEKRAAESIANAKKDRVEEWKRNGLKPQFASKDIPISMSLARNIQDYKEREVKRSAEPKKDNARDQGS